MSKREMKSLIDAAHDNVEGASSSRTNDQHETDSKSLPPSKNLRKRKAKQLDGSEKSSKPNNQKKPPAATTASKRRVEEIFSSASETASSCVEVHQPKAKRRHTSIEERNRQCDASVIVIDDYDDQAGAQLQSDEVVVESEESTNHRAGFARVARERAAFFAVSEVSNVRSKKKQRLRQDDAEDWCGPFSTARKLLNERDEVAEQRKQQILGEGIANSDNEEKFNIHWIGEGGGSLHDRVFHVPTLFDLCVRVISENFEYVEDLGIVPTALRTKLVKDLCYHLKLTEEVLSRLFPSDVTEIILPDCSRIDAATLQETLLRCRDALEVIELNSSGRCFNDSTVAAIVNAGGFPMLTHLTATGTFQLSDTSIKKLFEKLPKLSHLNLSLDCRLGKDGIDAIKNSFSNRLQSLSLSMCEWLDDSSLQSIADLSSLQQLDLSGITALSDNTLEVILKSCGSTLKVLKLDNCISLTDEAIFHISNYCGSALSNLSLRGLSAVNSESLLQSFKQAAEARNIGGTHSLSHLLELRLRDTAVGGIDDVVVDNIAAASAGSLKVLDLSGSDISDFGMSQLAACCKSSLEVLDISFCRGLSNPALGYLVDASEKLRKLLLWGNLQLNDTFYRKHSKTKLIIKNYACILWNDGDIGRPEASLLFTVCAYDVAAYVA